MTTVFFGGEIYTDVRLVIVQKKGSLFSFVIICDTKTVISYKNIKTVINILKQGNCKIK